MTISKSFNHLTLILGSFCCSPLLAQITLDGTLGQSGPLSGPDYQISSNLGQQVGGNLYHSFGRFNIHQGESATFAGPETVNNVIGRVTGGSPSQINGGLRSTIPNANVYLLNPAGIMFGKGAELDVQGSFYASTADTLRFQDGSEFNARQPTPSLLTVAPPQAFGFLTDTPATISVENSKLRVPLQNTLSLIGGNLLMKGTQRPYDNSEGFNASMIIPSVGTTLLAISGQINLASIASRGEVTLSESGIEFSDTAQGGQITLDNTLLNTMGSGGNIYIRAGPLGLHNSVLTTQNWHSESLQNGGIHIKADELTIHQGFVLSETYKDHDLPAGDIDIDVTGTLALIGGEEKNSYGGISVNSGKKDGFASAGNGGNIFLTAGNLILKNGAQIVSDTWDSGDGGNINIAVKGLVSLSGHGQDNFGLISCHISTSSEEESTGNGGTIDLKAGELYLGDGGQILANTNGFGRGGKINIKVAGTALLEGFKDSEVYSAVSVGSNSIATNSNAGTIDFQADELILKGGAYINSATFNQGQGGDIKVQTHLLRLDGNSELWAASENYFNGSGHAGNISVQAQRIDLINGGRISTRANRGNGGHITINTSKLLYLREGSITTDVKLGDSDGGNIMIEAPTFVVLDQASIISKAKRGYGGNIRVDSQQYLASTDKENILNASSDILERSGQIVITAPTNDLAVDRVSLPTMFFHNTLRQSCQSRDVEKIPSFSIRGCLHPPPDRMRGSLMREDWERLEDFDGN